MPTYEIVFRPTDKGESLKFSDVHAPTEKDAFEWAFVQLMRVGGDPINYKIEIRRIEDADDSKADSKGNKGGKKEKRADSSDGRTTLDGEREGSVQSQKTAL